MDIKTEPQEDGNLLVSFTHKDVSISRIVEPLLGEDGSVDEEETQIRITYLANSFETKVDMGLLTVDSVAMMEAPPVNVVPAIREFKRTVDKPN